MRRFCCCRAVWPLWTPGTFSRLLRRWLYIVMLIVFETFEALIVHCDASCILRLSRRWTVQLFYFRCIFRISWTFSPLIFTWIYFMPTPQCCITTLLWHVVYMTTLHMTASAWNSLLCAGPRWQTSRLYAPCAGKHFFLPRGHSLYSCFT